MRAHVQPFGLLLTVALGFAQPGATHEASAVEGRLDHGVGLAGLGDGHRYAIPVGVGETVTATLTWSGDGELALSANGPLRPCNAGNVAPCMSGAAGDAAAHAATIGACDADPSTLTYVAPRAGDVEILVWATSAGGPVEYVLTVLVDGEAPERVHGPANVLTGDLRPLCHVS